MPTQQKTSTTAAPRRRAASAAQQDSGFNIDIKSILYSCLGNWYWFIITIGISLSIANLYYRSILPVYTRSASIIVKDETSTTQQIGNNLSFLTNSSNNTSVNNEIIALKKASLMEKVVKRLGINTTYLVEGPVRSTVLYGSMLPVNVTFLAATDDTYLSCDVVIKDNRITIEHLCDASGMPDEGVYTGVIGKNIRTPYGDILVEKGMCYTDDLSKTIKVTHNTVGQTVGEILGNLYVGVSDEKSTVIDLVLNNGSVERADDILNTLIAIYNEIWIENKNQIAVSTAAFIDDRIKILDQELAELEKEILINKEKNGNDLISTAAAAQALNSIGVNPQDPAMALTAQLSLLEDLRDYITQPANYTEIIPFGLGIDNSVVTSSIAKYNDLIFNRLTIQANSNDNNPLFADIDKQLTVVRRYMLISIDNQAALLKTRIKALGVNIDEEGGSKTATIDPTVAQHMLSINRQKNVKESLYMLLLNKREDCELSKALTAYNTRVLNPASGSSAPTSPDKDQIHRIGFLIGLSIPILVILLLELSNTKVRGRKDLDKLTVPFVGEIPNCMRPEEIKSPLVKFLGHLRRRGKRRKRKDVQRIVVKSGSRNVINESFRVVRSNIEFIAGEGNGNKVIMITSCNPGSGKTFLLYNTSLCFALKENRVAIVDLDLRRASLSVYADKPSKGVSNYLNGTITDIHDVCLPSADNPNLHVYPVGVIPPNPSELLSSDRLPQLITALRAEYDLVFIDCPPAEIVADTAIISQHCDMTLFVVRADYMERSLLKVVQKYYDDKKFHNMCVLLNGTAFGNGRYGYKRYGYNYGYGYGYGYSYGYGSRRHGYGYGYNSYYGNDDSPVAR